MTAVLHSLKFAVGRWAATLGIAVAPLLFAMSAHAGQVEGTFKVTVKLVPVNTPSLPKSAFCRTTPVLGFGAVVTVVCATGEVVDISNPSQGASFVPTHGGAFRFMLPGSYAAGLPYVYDGYTGHGTAASWRVIQLADRDYYELLVGW